MEELQAITRLKQGDLSGLEVLVPKYYDQAVRTAYGIVRDYELAEDIVQTCFIQVSEKIDQFDGRRSFRPWFLRSVVNRAINAANQDKLLVSLDTEMCEQERPFQIDQFLASLPGPEDVLETKEMRQIVWRALGKLSPKQRAAITLRYYLEMSEVEITQEMNIPKSSVKWWLFTARERLRSLLHPFQLKKTQSAIHPPEAEKGQKG